MSRSRKRDQLQRIAVIGPLQHVESLPEAQIAEDIHGEVIAPVGHIPRGRPALALHVHIHITSGLTTITTKLLAERPDVGQHVPLHLADGAVGEGLREHAALAGVQGLVPRVVRVGHRVLERLVELRLAHVRPEPVDLL